METINLSDMAVTKVTQSETETEAGTKTKWAYVLDDGCDRKLTLAAEQDYGLVVGQKFSVTLKNPQTRLDDCLAGKTMVEVIPDSVVTEETALTIGIGGNTFKLDPKKKKEIQNMIDEAETKQKKMRHVEKFQPEGKKETIGICNVKRKKNTDIEEADRQLAALGEEQLRPGNKTAGELLKEVQPQPAKFVIETAIMGQKKSRWECPVCEARWNRAPEKDGQETTCASCKAVLLLKRGE